MTAFADSSAVVKLYATETGTEAIDALERPLYVSALARVEVPAALWRKHRTGMLGAEEVTALTAAFAAGFHDSEEEPRRFRSVPVTPQIITRAADLLSQHNLRAYDAVQLSTALTVRGLDPQIRFACFDIQLRSAAIAEHLSLVPQPQENLPDRPAGGH